MPLFLLFIRFLPVIAISEVKGVLPESDAHYPDWQKLKEGRTGADSYEIKRYRIFIKR